MDNKLKYQIDLSLKDLVSSSLAKVRKGFERLDTPFLLSKARGVQEVSLALGHVEPVSVGCPLYNEASVFTDFLVLSSTIMFSV